MAHTDELKDGTVREWWTYDSRSIQHHKAVYIVYRTWKQMFPWDTSREGVPFTREWAMYEEHDYWSTVNYAAGEYNGEHREAGVYRERTHYWTLQGRADRDPEVWIKDPQNRCFRTYEEAREPFEESQRQAIRAAEQRIKEARAALTLTQHECATFPIEIPA